MLFCLASPVSSSSIYERLLLMLSFVTSNTRHAYTAMSLFAPKIRNKGNITLVTEGEDARLTCLVSEKGTSGNKPIVFWEKNNDTLQPASHNRMRIKPYRYLKIKRVTKEDAGFYTCVAENSCGRKALTWRLFIESKLLWRSIPAKMLHFTLYFWHFILQLLFDI